jgi:hypothetical protein
MSCGPADARGEVAVGRPLRRFASGAGRTAAAGCVPDRVHPDNGAGVVDDEVDVVSRARQEEPSVVRDHACVVARCRVGSAAQMANGGLQLPGKQSRRSIPVCAPPGIYGFGVRRRQWRELDAKSLQRQSLRRRSSTSSAGMAAPALNSSSDLRSASWRRSRSSSSRSSP